MHAIPAELRNLDQWVVWRLEERDGKPTKVPYRAADPKRRRRRPTRRRGAATKPLLPLSRYGITTAERTAWTGSASSSRPTTRTSASTWTCLDAAPARSSSALGSYTERSVSGRGAHVIVRASLNGHPRHRQGPIGVYSEARYFVMTGEHIMARPDDDRGPAGAAREGARPLPAAVEPGSMSRVRSQPVDLDDRGTARAAVRRKQRRRVPRALGRPTGRPLPVASPRPISRSWRDLRFWTGADPRGSTTLFRRSRAHARQVGQRRGERLRRRDDRGGDRRRRRRLRAPPQKLHSDASRVT